MITNKEADFTESLDYRNGFDAGMRGDRKYGQSRVWDAGYIAGMLRAALIDSRLKEAGVRR